MWELIIKVCAPIAALAFIGCAIAGMATGKIYMGDPNKPVDRESNKGAYITWISAQLFMGIAIGILWLAIFGSLFKNN